MKVHATVVAIGGRGVMITGPSGSGKSDLALRLIDRGAILVGDDYVDYDQGVARAIATIAGRIEVRGIGITETPYLESVSVALAIDLGHPPERLPSFETSLRTVPVVALAPFEASAPLKVELALKRVGLALEPPGQ